MLDIAESCDDFWGTVPLEQFEEFVLPSSTHGPPWASAEALFARDLQLHFEALVPRLSVERIAD
ncbi:MAG: hypothetical protein AAGA01_15010, partial [Cyanobacteria bacterium P01_E01_bin.43]